MTQRGSEGKHDSWRFLNRPTKEANVGDCESLGFQMIQSENLVRFILPICLSQLGLLKPPNKEFPFLPLLIRDVPPDA